MEFPLRQGIRYSVLFSQDMQNTNLELLPPRERALADLMVAMGMNASRAAECLSLQDFDFALARYVYTRTIRD